MFTENKSKKRFSFNIHSQFTGFVLAAGVALGGISLIVIAIRLAPISKQANNWNKCVNTTANFLLTVPEFRAAGKQGIEAMAVSLCNGSIPQKVAKRRSP